MKNKRDILFLCQFFYPEYISSATLPTDASIALTEAGFTVDVLCGFPKEYSMAEQVKIRDSYNGIMIQRLKYIQLKRQKALGRMINYFSFTIAVLLRFFIFRKYKTIIVYSNPPVLPIVTALANIFFKTKVIFVSFDIYPEIALISKSITSGGVIHKLMLVANKLIFKHVTKVIALSNEMKSFLIKNRQVLKAEQIDVVPNWCVEDEGLGSTEPVMHPGLLELQNRGGIIISYFGNMGVCQDMDTIITAIRLLKENEKIHFLFAGHGNKLDMIKACIINENLKNATVYDYLHGQDFIDALRVSDCFLVSLIEGLTGLCVPSKIYSYLTAAKPIIAVMERDFDIVKELIDSDAGYQINQGDADALVSIILGLYADRQKISTMGANSKNIFEMNYKKSHCTKQYVEILRQQIEN